ncbi:hypothetical protein [Chitinibacter tainanensis]|uniref:hypothetical protein n=1 Tax=Chitinibacter tainanensis TaxID=230667 RepID=UPI00041D9590|nr:hypothetical protein [Chitinibacter tainanensis]
MNTDTFTNKLNRRSEAVIQEEARLANQLQRENPTMTRTEALKIAKETLEREGWWSN